MWRGGDRACGCQAAQGINKVTPGNKLESSPERGRRPRPLKIQKEKTNLCLDSVRESIE